MTKITHVGLDADDTLWQNEVAFRLTIAQFTEMLSEFADPDHLSDRLDAAERRNIKHYGFGVKGFTLSMIETAIEVTEGAVSAAVIADILAAGREMLSRPVDLLPGVADTVATLADQFHLVVISKGDLLDQERKVAASGLAGHFAGVEVVSDKTPDTYASIFGSRDAPHWAMIGNSLRSDILPPLELGALAIHVAHDLTWGYEQALPPIDHPRFHQAADLAKAGAILRNF